MFNGFGYRDNNGGPGVKVDPVIAAKLAYAAGGGNQSALAQISSISAQTFNDQVFIDTMNQLRQQDIAKYSEQNKQVMQQNNGGGSGFSGDSGVGIADVTFKGIETLGNLGLGIWKGIEQAKNNKTMRQAMVKQMQVAQEQINASQQARKERASELARLNKVRSNTNKQFNTSAQVSRSY